jgi:hypothetical protein
VRGRKRKRESGKKEKDRKNLPYPPWKKNNTKKNNPCVGGWMLPCF